MDLLQSFKKKKQNFCYAARSEYTLTNFQASHQPSIDFIFWWIINIIIIMNMKFNLCNERNKKKNSSKIKAINSYFISNNQNQKKKPHWNDYIYICI